MVLVNLRPSFLKKTSCGLDLAVMAGILWKTQQLPLPDWLKYQPYIYGEISLTGQVQGPADLARHPIALDRPVLTGPFLTLEAKNPKASQMEDSITNHKNEIIYPGPIQIINDLEDLKHEIVFEQINQSYNRNEQALTPPMNCNIRFSKKQARIMSVVAAGEHNLLIVGPHGQGKTILAQNILPLLKPPDSDLLRSIQDIWAKYFNQAIISRPFVQPHHSTPAISMIGGGRPLMPGELSRAHGGILLLDEILEFDQQVIEALRQPAESDQIVIARGGVLEPFPCRILLLATSNLCYCGHYLPGRSNRCRCSARRRHLYFSRLTGPFLDRFAMAVFCDGWIGENKTVSMSEIQKLVQNAQSFAMENRGQCEPNSRLNLAQIQASKVSEVSESLSDLAPTHSGSLRRTLEVWRVARTLADLDRQEKMHPTHLAEAAQWTLHSHHLLMT